MLDGAKLLGDPYVKPPPVPEQKPAEPAAPTTVETSESVAAQTSLPVEETSVTSAAESSSTSAPAALITAESESSSVSSSASSTSDGIYSYTPPANLYQEYQKLLDWDRPLNLKGHWPPYQDYVYAEYDPNAWEQFDQYGFLNNIFTKAS